jgi:hypothetical protein
MAQSKLCAIKVVIITVTFAYGFIANRCNLWNFAIVYCHPMNAVILLFNKLASYESGDIIVKCALFITLVKIGFFTVGFGIEIRVRYGCIILVILIGGICSARFAINFNKLSYIFNDSVHNITINRAFDYAAEVLALLVGVIFARLGTFGGRLTAIFGPMAGFAIIITLICLFGCVYIPVIGSRI